MTKGYAWLPDRMRASGGLPVQTRILGRTTTAVRGREAVRLFYDDQHVRRRSALPGPVLDTLFGRGAVHTLDGQQHLARKALFMSLLKNRGAVARLAERAGAEWDAAARDWAVRPAVELFTESSRVLTRAVCDWAGIPLGAAETAELADDLVAMVDGFAAIGPRHLKARAARARREVWLEALIRTARAEAGTDPGTGRGTEYPAGSPL
ncbi:cytochrome P450, partial [Streptomyces sp. NPDC051098]